MGYSLSTASAVAVKPGADGAEPIQLLAAGHPPWMSFPRTSRLGFYNRLPLLGPLLSRGLEDSLNQASSF